MSGPQVTVTHRSARSCLAEVACSLGRRDRPYPEIHEAAWTIAWVRSGSFCYRGSASKGRHVLHSGWLLVGAPRAAFECSHDRDGGDHCTSLTLSETTVEEMSVTTGRDVAKLLAATPVLAPVARLGLLLERARRRPDADLDEVACLAGEAVLAWAAGAPLPSRTPALRDRRRVEQAIERIEASRGAGLSLAALSEEAGLGLFHFLRVFRRVTGTTPHQYVMGARLRWAARLLLETERPVTAIAWEAGFNDLSNFMRCFRAASGLTPRRYRQIR